MHAHLPQIHAPWLVNGAPVCAVPQSQCPMADCNGRLAFELRGGQKFSCLFSQSAGWLAMQDRALFAFFFASSRDSTQMPSAALLSVCATPHSIVSISPSGHLALPLSWCDFISALHRHCPSTRSFARNKLKLFSRISRLISSPYVPSIHLTITLSLPLHHVCRRPFFGLAASLTTPVPIRHGQVSA